MSNILRRLAITLFATVLTTATMLGGVKSAQAAIFTSADILAQSELFAHDPMFQSVGWLGGSQNQGSSFFFAGSGVLIDPYWVLTAGHNLTRPDNSGLDAVVFGLSNSIFDDLSHVAAEAWFPFPGYSGTTPAGHGNDIGLVRLVDPILDVAPAERFRGVDEAGTHAFMAGYGSPGVWPNFGDFDGIMRAGENIVDGLGRPTSAVESQYLVSTFSLSNPLPFEWQSSPGDSGGAWLAEFDGSMQLIGINGFTRGQNTLSGAIRVSLYNDWIDETMASYDGAAVVPEPSTWMMFLMGIVLIGFSRRYRFVAAAD